MVLIVAMEQHYRVQMEVRSAAVSIDICTPPTTINKHLHHHVLGVYA